MQQYRNWQPQEPEHHYDMRALVFGVVSFLFCQLPILSIVTGIIALVYAARAKKTAALLQPRHGNGRHDIGYYRDLYGCIVQYLLGL